MGSPSGYALRAAAAAGVDCILRPKASPQPPELWSRRWIPGRHLSVQQLPRAAWQPKDAERRVESPGEFAVAGRSGRGDSVLRDLSVLLLA